MGLMFPDDLAAWHRWHADRHRLRSLRAGLRPRSSIAARLHVRGPAPRLLVVLETTAPTSRIALLEPLRDLGDLDVAILAAPVDLGELPGIGWRTREVTAETWAKTLNRADSVAAVVAAGDYLPLGGLAGRWAAEREIPFVVVQHGLTTPAAPPLPQGAHLLTWTPADAEFWWSGRTDGSTAVVGSQLLWQAAAEAATHPNGGARIDPQSAPTYLGQLHAAELPRRELASAAYTFCRDHHALYRPHPSELDRASRALHEVWRRRGIAFDDGSVPLRELRTPVVAVFSTGILEAAAAGVPAWVDFPRPPAWLAEFWDRYGMSRFGMPPTPPPAAAGDGDTPPAARIAAELTRIVEA